MWDCKRYYYVALVIDYRRCKYRRCWLNILGDIAPARWHKTKKNRSAKRTCVGFDLLLFHSVGVLVLNVSIRELKYYKWIGHHWKDIGINLNRLSNIIRYQHRWVVINFIEGWLQTSNWLVLEGLLEYLSQLHNKVSK